jgi:16S rRNA (guanine966-N2)-methyltransferase
MAHRPIHRRLKRSTRDSGTGWDGQDGCDYGTKTSDRYGLFYRYFRPRYRFYQHRRPYLSTPCSLRFPMRIIAGSARGIHLDIPGHDIRPTTELTRGAIFSALADRVLNARVLDLFAGSGALGLEAISRGASRVCFVESNPRSIRAIQNNLQKTRLNGEVRKEDVFHFLRCSQDGWDLIFADPPYAKYPGDPDYGDQLLHSQELPQRLAPVGLLVLERAVTKKEPVQLPPNWILTKTKQYGSTEVLFIANQPDATVSL